MSFRSRLAASIWAERPKNYSRENTRRLKQIRKGHIRGQYIDEEARYAAHGLLGPKGKAVELVTSLTED